MNITKIVVSLMDSIYDFLYENDTQEALALESFNAGIFDNVLETENADFRELLKDVVNYRHDAITSDREAAAFIIAARAVGLEV